jgi:hypothetical protein
VVEVINLNLDYLVSLGYFYNDLGG